MFLEKLKTKIMIWNVYENFDQNCLMKCERKKTKQYIQINILFIMVYIYICN